MSSGGYRRCFASRFRYEIFENFHFVMFAAFKRIFFFCLRCVCDVRVCVVSSFIWFDKNCHAQTTRKPMTLLNLNNNKSKRETFITNFTIWASRYSKKECERHLWKHKRGRYAFICRILFLWNEEREPTKAPKMCWNRIAHFYNIHEWS